MKWLESGVVPQNHTLTRPIFTPRTCFLNDKFSALDKAGPLELTGISQNAPLELPAKLEAIFFKTERFICKKLELPGNVYINFVA